MFCSSLLAEEDGSFNCYLTCIVQVMFIYLSYRKQPQTLQVYLMRFVIAIKMCIVLLQENLAHWSNLNYIKCHRGQKFNL